MSYTQDAELAHYKTLEAIPILKKLGFSEYKHTTDETGKLVKLKELGFERGSIRAHPFLGRSGQWMCRFPKSGSIRDKQFGTIVDVAYAIAGNLGKARQLLRDATGYTPTGTSSPVSPISTTSAHETTAQAKETTPVAAPLAQVSPKKPSPDELFAAYEEEGIEWTAGQSVPAYLQSRCIDSVHPIFSGTFRHSFGKRNDLAFPFRHFDADGGWEFAGHEQKRKGYVSYSENGTAGIFVAMPPSAKKIVVTESVVDAISYARLMTPFDDMSTGFIVVRSGSEKSAVILIEKMIEHCGTEIVILATDNDPAGMMYAHKVGMGLYHLRNKALVRYKPPLLAKKDWNDSLVEKVNRARSDAQSIKAPGEFDPSDGIELS